MPTDYWAKARDKDIARLVLAEQRAEERRQWDNSRPKSRPTASQKKKPRRIWACRKCKCRKTITEPIIFNDGTEHTKRCCARCKRFIKWG